jgi:hypothetical protein
MTQAYLFVAANAVVHEAWILTSNEFCGSDFGSLGVAHKNGGHRNAAAN